MQEHRNTWPRRISIISVAVVFLLCGLVLMGWKTHNIDLIEMLPRYVPMVAWSAICFICLGIALSLRLIRTSSTKVKNILLALSMIFILLPVIIATLNFCENCLLFDAHIDALLFPDFLKEVPFVESGRMSLQASLAVICIGLGFLFLVSPHPRRALLGQILLIIAGSFGLLGLVAHMYGVGKFFGIAHNLGMSVPTAACSVYTAIGLLALRTDIGLTTFFVEQGGGSILVQQLLWTSLVVPLMVSLLISWAENLKLFEPSVGSSLYTIITVVGFFTLISYVAKKINEAESEKLNFAREQTARKQAEEAVKERDEFLSICSHELKTPLTSMQLQFQLTQYKIQNGDIKVFEPENVKKQVENTNRQIRRLGRLIEDMLDVSRVTSGKLFLDFKSVNLTHLIHEVVDDLKAQLEAARTTVEISADTEVMIECDRHWIGQVITNLLTNAGLKYGAGKPVKVMLRKERKTAILSVEDKGIGIAPEDHRRIFQRFERGVSAESFSGLGLGLYITFQIIKGHSGNIDVKSEYGKGSLFTVTLPMEIPMS